MRLKKQGLEEKAIRAALQRGRPVN
jgi:hypothetical protein